MTTRTLIAGNWKMNLNCNDGVALVKNLLNSQSKHNRVEMVIFPPATLLAPIGPYLENSTLKLGAQDCHFNDSGAHTGDVSAKMLADLGCRYVILGHSERRADHNESDALVRTKVSNALKSGLSAVVCVGETGKDRELGKEFQVVERQLRASIPSNSSHENIVVAYEPIWAIGTGSTPSTENIAKMHANISRVMKDFTSSGGEFRIIYGGSVTRDNATEILSLKEVNGALVGGASLNAEHFQAIANAAI